MSSHKVIVKASKIAGKRGLFANCDFAEDGIIVEFKPCEKGDKIISFPDGKKLTCGDKSLGMQVRDIIDFPKQKRKLFTTLMSDEPFFKKHENCDYNSYIKLFPESHRAFLKASRAIKKGEEIFCHYGFDYWIHTELTTLGYEIEDEIVKEHKLSCYLYTYPAFQNYIRDFYPDLAEINVVASQKNPENKKVILITKNNKHLPIDIVNLNDLIRFVPLPSL